MHRIKNGVVAIDSYGAAGVAIGGCRRRDYASHDRAATECLALARNMGRKYAAMGMPFGGLKVVLEKPGVGALADFLNEREGCCYVASDMGFGRIDLEELSKRTPYVLVDDEVFLEMLAHGVLHSIRAAQEWLGIDQPSYALHGLGKSGLAIAKALGDVEITGYDIDPEARARARKMGVMTDKNLLDAKAEVFIPASIGEATANVRTRIVAGPANLQAPSFAEIHVPDYLAGAGAILLDDLLVAGMPVNRSEGLARTRRIYRSTREWLEATHGA